MAKNQDARIYFESEYGKIYLGDSLELLKKTPDNSVNLITELSQVNIYQLACL